MILKLRRTLIIYFLLYRALDIKLAQNWHKIGTVLPMTSER